MQVYTYRSLVDLVEKHNRWPRCVPGLRALLQDIRYSTGYARLEVPSHFYNLSIAAKAATVLGLPLPYAVETTLQEIFVF